MFKVEKPDMVNKTFRLPAELVERLQVVGRLGIPAQQLEQCLCYQTDK